MGFSTHGRPFFFSEEGIKKEGKRKKYRVRLNGPTFEVFRHCGTFFFKKNIYHQRVRLHFFWSFATEWMLKNPKGFSLAFFRHCETFQKKSSNGPEFTNTLTL